MNGNETTCGRRRCALGQVRRSSFRAAESATDVAQQAEMTDSRLKTLQAETTEPRARTLQPVEYP